MTNSVASNVQLKLFEAKKYIFIFLMKQKTLFILFFYNLTKMIFFFKSHMKKTIFEIFFIMKNYPISFTFLD